MADIKNIKEILHLIKECKDVVDCVRKGQTIPALFESKDVILALEPAIDDYLVAINEELPDLDASEMAEIAAICNDIAGIELVKSEMLAFLRSAVETVRLLIYLVKSWKS